MKNLLQQTTARLFFSLFRERFLFFVESGKTGSAWVWKMIASPATKAKEFTRSSTTSFHNIILVPCIHFSV
jgi:hypothetical protein